MISELIICRLRKRKSAGVENRSAASQAIKKSNYNCEGSYAPLRGAWSLCTLGASAPLERPIWYCKAVETGTARGMNNLAILLSNGSGVPPDLEQARDLWRQAAALGHVNAVGNLAFSYLQGPGAEQDQEKALFWMRLAAEAGHL